MPQHYPIIPGAEPWSSPGVGERSRVGVVVVHGFTGNPLSTRPLGEALATQGFRVEVVRLPGHGTHWRDMMHTRYADWRAECERALDALRGECDAVALAGFSMGGTIILDVASQRPNDVAGIVPINATILDREGVVAKFAPLLARVVPAVPASAAGLVKNDATRDGVDEKAYGWIPMKAAQSAIDELPRIRKQLRGMTVPVLVVWSRHDGTVPPKNSLAIPSLVGKDGRVEMLELERSRHIAALDVDCELLFNRASEFITSLEPAQ